MTNRPLTQEELEIAWSLDWKPTNYHVDAEGGVRLESNSKYYYISKSGADITGYIDKITSVTSPIPQKPFDIESVEWGDVGVIKVSYDDGKIFTEFYDSSLGFYETKQDIINKAKALGITAEDLK